ncbi:hypothetical protein T440DRAFT_282048 [Plenodomus tracheiphilus IPT5]|uniref:DUF6594 domain-containing protein n=1 Tax=Plenodomus tracheiphilus IPT5 TaxID=1408161 RepID=A0A6A7APV1_9PLEO|nr:hypothetical protein T440DRAFT_282048 [Plenodomus tracheiphilus IPT5]
MSDRRYFAGGAPPPSRHQSPAQGNPQYHFDSLNGTLGTQPQSASHTRRRPSRTNSSTNNPPLSASPPCVESNSGSDKRAKASQNTLKKVTRRDSGYTETSAVLRPEREDFHEANDTAGFLPKLSQIREGKASTASRSRGSSTISSAIGSKSRNRRHIEDDAVDRSRERQKHGSSQRHPDSLANLSNSSLISVDSGVTQQSSTSGGSNSTVTRRSHDNGSQKMTLEPPYQGRGATSQVALNPQTLANMDAPQADVFQFLRPDSKANSIVSDDTHHMTPPTTASSSSSSSSSGDTRLNNDQSSTAGTFPHEVESPTSSPISMRKSDNEDFHYQGRDYRQPGAPLYASSFVHGHEGEDEDDSNNSDEGEDQDEDQEEKESGEEASETESEEEHDDDAHTNHAELGHASSLTLNKVPPPTAPSTSSRPSDPHTRRLRQQERNLANHILQSPQPQREFQFGVDASAGHQPMPLYSPRAYSGVSPVAPHATAGPSLAWPPVPPMPAPLPIGYSPHQSPERNHAFPLTVRPPGEAMQQMPAPFPPHFGQPPVYQTHAPGPDLSRTTLLGYELLADKLSQPTSTGSKRSAKGSKGRIVPMYRKFEHLNHRVLLHLQDEVSEMEEDLRHLDEVIAQTTLRDESGRSYPGSRRGDARFGGESHYRRTELLGRIFQKLGQYNQALCSFNTLLKELDPTTAEDVQAYRTWMDKRTPIDYAETRFLAREQDLVAVSHKSSATTNHNVRHHHSAAVWFPLTLTLPLMAFAMIPSVLGRLVVIALICGAELWMVTVTPELREFMSTQEWISAAAV